jgi:hypothetical protein
MNLQKLERRGISLTPHTVANVSLPVEDRSFTLVKAAQMTEVLHLLGLVLWLRTSE